MKKVVVCANFGGKDYIKDPVNLMRGDDNGHNPDWEYHYFTDQPFHSDIWKIHHLNAPCDTRELAREIKWRTHEFVNYDVCLWIDASMTLKKDPDYILEQMGDKNFLIKLHSERNTTDQEVDACIRFNRIGEQEGKVVRNWLKSVGYNERVQDMHLLWETGIYMKRNDAKLNRLLNEVYDTTINHTFNRDQLCIRYLFWREKYPIKELPHHEVWTWIEYVRHRDEESLPHVRYFHPFATDGNLGAEYNRSVYHFQDDDWVAICDGDMCFLDVRVKKWIAKTIKENKDYDIYVPMTNRLRDKQQVVAAMFPHRDIVLHKDATVKQWKKYQTAMVEAGNPPAGLMMIAKAGTFKDVKFRNGLLLLDTDFMARAKAKGYKIGIMRGIYAFHYYRLAEGHDKTHHLRQ